MEAEEGRQGRNGGDLSNREREGGEVKRGNEAIQVTGNVNKGRDIGKEGKRGMPALGS